MYIIYLFAGLFAGMMLPVQTAVNNRLKGYTYSPFIASLISFSVGSAILTTISLFTYKRFSHLPALFVSTPWWIWFCGGALGVIFLTNNILLLPRLGAALTVMTTIGGQMIMAILIDYFGWFQLPVHELSFKRVSGALFMFFGIFFMQKFQKNTPFTQNKPRKRIFLFMIIGFVAGMTSPVQTAINGKLRAIVGSPFLAATISFLVGTLLLFALSFIIHKRVTFAIKEKIPQWVFAGGALGVIFITSNILLLPLLGAAMTVVLAVCGQMIIALLIDHFGLFGSPRRLVNGYRIAGIIFMVIGIILIQSL